MDSIPKKAHSYKPEASPLLIELDVPRDKWIAAIREIQEDHDIREGSKQDDLSSRRIANLLGELYISRFHGSRDNVPVVEKDGFDLAMEHKLRCDPLEREERYRGKDKKQALFTWGVDKTSELEGYTTQLKEWTARALFERKEENKDGADREKPGPAYFGGGPTKNIGFEEIGLG